MSKKTGTGSTRLHTSHFLVGPEQLDLGKEARIGKLPRIREVMQYFFFRTNLKLFGYEPPGKAICCPLQTEGIMSNCSDNPECSSSMECIVWKLKHGDRWLESGIPIIRNLSITKKLIKLNDEYWLLSKDKSSPKPDKVKKEAFVQKFDSLFDISCHDMSRC